MRYYIDREGLLTPFEKFAQVHESYTTAKKNISKPVFAEMNDLLQSLVTNSRVLYLHPRYEGNVGSIADTAFFLSTPFNQDMLIDCLQRNESNDYYVIAHVKYEPIGVHIRVLCMDEEDYNRSFRLHLIDTFLAEN